MELETRCESELEQAEEHFQHKQKYVTQNAKIRQVKKLFFVFYF
jgi:ribosomal protein L29